MCKIILCVVLAMLIPVGVFAQTGQSIETCQHISWKSLNQESDHIGFYVYVSQDLKPAHQHTFGKEINEATCSELRIISGHTYYIGITAFNKVGNESTPQGLKFTFTDTTHAYQTPPEPIDQVCVVGSRSEANVALCLPEDTDY